MPIPETVKKGLEPEPNASDFTKIKDLGAGSFGTVYLAEHNKTKVKYAIKRIDKKDKTNIEETPYFRREIEIMYKIRHPNVVRLYGHFEDDRYIYFVMEYVSRGNLYDLALKDKNKSISLENIALILKDVMSAVYFLHNMDPKIIHRDIKPENVLISEDGVAKLTDFGWSNYMQPDEVRKTICGTPIYLAPEIISGVEHDEKVDIWCLGVLLFELCTRNVPFAGNDLETLKNNIQHMRISWPSKIPLSAKNVISKILKYRPEDRPTIPEIFEHPFFSDVIPNIKDYLIKPDPNQPHRPFIISEDDPKKEEELIAQMGKTKGKATESKEISGNYEQLKEDYRNLMKKIEQISNKAALEEEKNILVKQCNALRQELNQKEVEVSKLRRGNIEDQTENLRIINQLEEENKMLKIKCEQYEKVIEEEKKNSSLEKAINELKQDTAGSKGNYMKEIQELESEIDIESQNQFKKLLKEKQIEINKNKEQLAMTIENIKKKFEPSVNKYKKLYAVQLEENNKLKKNKDK